MQKPTTALLFYKGITQILNPQPLNHSVTKNSECSQLFIIILKALAKVSCLSSTFQQNKAWNVQLNQGQNMKRFCLAWDPTKLMKIRLKSKLVVDCTLHFLNPLQHKDELKRCEHRHHFQTCEQKFKRSSADQYTGRQNKFNCFSVLSQSREYARSCWKYFLSSHVLCQNTFDLVSFHLIYSL